MHWCKEARSRRHMSSLLESDVEQEPAEADRQASASTERVSVCSEESPNAGSPDQEGPHPNQEGQ